MIVDNSYKYEFKGHCPICENDVIFHSNDDWFRDHLLCDSCLSIPRERALMKVINDFFPNYRSLKIHETSPCLRGVSLKLNNQCLNYSYSHFFPDILSGSIHEVHGCRSENIENLSFENDMFDIFISQDVLEHIFNPRQAFKEIHRVLKKGGAHIFTVPIVNKAKKSFIRAERSLNGKITYRAESVFHGNPIDNQGSLVTMDWGYDIVQHILEASGMTTLIFNIDNINFGIQAEYIDVFLSIKKL